MFVIRFSKQAEKDKKLLKSAGLEAHCFQLSHKIRFKIRRRMKNCSEILTAFFHGG